MHASLSLALERNGAALDPMPVSPNLFEFAIALRLRDLEIAASFGGAILYVLRAFEKSVAKRVSDFSFPGSLREGRPRDIRLIISDEARLYPNRKDQGGKVASAQSRG